MGLVTDVNSSVTVTAIQFFEDIILAVNHSVLGTSAL